MACALPLSAGASTCTLCAAGSFYGSTGVYGLGIRYPLGLRVAVIWLCDHLAASHADTGSMRRGQPSLRGCRTEACGGAQQGTASDGQLGSLQATAGCASDDDGWGRPLHVDVLGRQAQPPLLCAARARPDRTPRGQVNWSLGCLCSRASLARLCECQGASLTASVDRDSPCFQCVA